MSSAITIVYPSTRMGPRTFEGCMSLDHEPKPVRIASLAMYRDPSVITMATHKLWAFVRDRLREDRLPDVPQLLDETIAYDAAWLDPRLLLAQACALPAASWLRGKIRLVATPIYDHPGCHGAMGGSFAVVHKDSPAASIADLRGQTAAINGRLSNSGTNVLRHLAAPHAVDGHFFGNVVVSGSHVVSLALVANDTAQVAAIDCVTYGNLARFAPEQLVGTRILTETVKTPALPFITAAATSDRDLKLLREALLRVVVDPAMHDACDTLALRGFELLPDSAYDATLTVEQEAAALGYPELA